MLHKIILLLSITMLVGCQQTAPSNRAKSVEKEYVTIDELNVILEEYSTKDDIQNVENKLDGIDKRFEYYTTSYETQIIKNRLIRLEE